MIPVSPWSETVRLNQIGTGLSREMLSDDETRARIARSLDLVSLDRLEARLELAPATIGWRLTGRLVAELNQACGITLEPLPVRIDDRFTVLLAEQVEPEADEIIVSLDEDAPDLIEDGKIDLGQYVVEQLALRLDPFPRKPGAVFVQPPEPAEISPFAALKRLGSSDEG